MAWVDDTCFGETVALGEWKRRKAFFFEKKKQKAFASAVADGRSDTHHCDGLR